MTQGHAGIEREESSDNDNLALRPIPTMPKAPVEPKKPGLRQRWNLVQTSKTSVFWLMLGATVITMNHGLY